MMIDDDDQDDHDDDHDDHDDDEDDELAQGFLLCVCLCL